MSKKMVRDAVFFKDSTKPKCPSCQYNLKLAIVNYGVEENKRFFVSECDICDTPIRYIVNGDDYPIKTKIVERKKKK
jgi:hypothetical protein